MTQWESTRGRIIHATSNSKQVIISVEDGQIVYFELDAISQQLQETETHYWHTQITCLDVGEVPEGRQRCRFLAVGSTDKTVKILSLDPEGCLKQISMQAMPAVPESVALISLREEEEAQQQLFLHIGLDNGVLLRTVVDNVTGVLSDSRSRFLGSNSISLSKVQQQGSPAVVALCGKPWLCYQYMRQYNVTPLDYTYLESIASFCTSGFDDALIGIAGDQLHIFYPAKHGETFT